MQRSPPLGFKREEDTCRVKSKLTPPFLFSYKFCCETCCFISPPKKDSDAAGVLMNVREEVRVEGGTVAQSSAGRGDAVYCVGGGTLSRLPRSRTRSCPVILTGSSHSFQLQEGGTHRHTGQLIID